MSLLQKGIRRRWMLNSIGTVFLVLLVAMISFSVFVGNYYYNSMRSALQTQASAVSDFFSSYATSERTYLEMANYYINDFDERESLELQFISTSGKIVLSSYGLTSGGSPGTNDIAQSIKTRTYPPGPVETPPLASASWRSLPPFSIGMRSREPSGWSPVSPLWTGSLCSSSSSPWASVPSP